MVPGDFNNEDHEAIILLAVGISSLLVMELSEKMLFFVVCKDIS